MALQKVNPGQRFKMPAEAYNAFVEAAQAHKSNLNQTVSRKSPNTRDIITIKNMTGETLERFNIVGIGEPLYDPDTQPIDFSEDIIFEGETPNTDYHVGKWAILLDGCIDDNFVEAKVIGVTACKIDVDNEDYRYVEIVDGEYTLAAAASGSAQILWKEAGTGLDLWAVIRIDASGGGGEPLMYQATADQITGSGGATVTAKRVAADGTLDTTEETLTLYDGLYPVLTGDTLVTTLDKDGVKCAIRVQGNADNPLIISPGAGINPDLTSWDITDQPEGYQGVNVTKWSRIFYVKAADQFYEFTREGKFDSWGNLIYVGAEEKTVIDGDFGDDLADTYYLTTSGFNNPPPECDVSGVALTRTSQYLWINGTPGTSVYWELRFENNSWVIEDFGLNHITGSIPGLPTNESPVGTYTVTGLCVGGNQTGTGVISE